MKTLHAIRNWFWAVICFVILITVDIYTNGSGWALLVVGLFLALITVLFMIFGDLKKTFD